MNHITTLVSNLDAKQRQQYENGVTLLALLVLQASEGHENSENVATAAGRDPRNVLETILPKTRRSLYVAHLWGYSKLAEHAGGRVDDGRTADKIGAWLELPPEGEVLLKVSERRYDATKGAFGSVFIRTYQIDTYPIEFDRLWAATGILMDRVGSFFNGIESSPTVRELENLALKRRGFSFLYDEEKSPVVVAV